MKAYAAWCYPNGTNSAMYESDVPPVLYSGSAQYTAGGWVQLSNLSPSTTNITEVIGGLVGGSIGEVRTVSAQSVGPGLIELAANQANMLGVIHYNDCTISGAGLWVGYGEGSPTTYWLFKSNP